MLHSDRVGRILIRWNSEHAILLQYCVRSCWASYLRQNALTLPMELAALREFNLLNLQMDDVVSLG